MSLAPLDAALLAPFEPEAIIFDMDGTLLATEALYRQAQRQTALAMGHDLPEDVHRQFVGVHREVNDRTLRKLWGEGVDLDAFNTQAEALFDTLWRADLPLRPGAVELLEMLKGTGLPLGLCTSTRSPKAQEKLRVAGFIDLFDSIVTLNDVENPKPHPEPYLISARNLGVAPARCVVVEDSHNGLRAGAAAGMTVLFVPDLIEADEEARSLAHAIMPDLHRVNEWIAGALVG